MSVLGSGSTPRMVSAAALIGVPAYFLVKKADCPNLETVDKALLYGLIALGIVVGFKL